MVELGKVIVRIFSCVMLNKENPSSDCLSRKSKESEEKLDASLMYGALFTWLILQMTVLPLAGGGSCMSRICHLDGHAGKLDNNRLSR